jgi:hypothetical protein
VGVICTTLFNGRTTLLERFVTPMQIITEAPAPATAGSTGREVNPERAQSVSDLSP